TGGEHRAHTECNNCRSQPRPPHRYLKSTFRGDERSSTSRDRKGAVKLNRSLAVAARRKPARTMKNSLARVGQITALREAASGELVASGMGAGQVGFRSPAAGPVPAAPGEPAHPPAGDPAPPTVAPAPGCSR